MPLTSKGRKIMRSMTEEYGEKKGKQVFYASKNAGRISGVDARSAVLDGVITKLRKRRTRDQFPPSPMPASTSPATTGGFTANTPAYHDQATVPPKPATPKPYGAPEMAAKMQSQIFGGPTSRKIDTGKDGRMARDYASASRPDDKHGIGKQPKTWQPGKVFDAGKPSAFEKNTKTFAARQKPKDGGTAFERNARTFAMRQKPKDTKDTDVDLPKSVKVPARIESTGRFLDEGKSSAREAPGMRPEGKKSDVLGWCISGDKRVFFKGAVGDMIARGVPAGDALRAALKQTHDKYGVDDAKILGGRSPKVTTRKPKRVVGVRRVRKAPHY